MANLQELVEEHLKALAAELLKTQGNIYALAAKSGLLAENYNGPEADALHAAVCEAGQIAQCELCGVWLPQSEMSQTTLGICAACEEADNG